MYPINLKPPNRPSDGAKFFRAEGCVRAAFFLFPLIFATININCDEMASNLEIKLEKIESEIKKLKRDILKPTSKKKFFRSAGSWKKVNTERLKKKVYDSRKSPSRRKVEL